MQSGPIHVTDVEAQTSSRWCGGEVRRKGSASSSVILVPLTMVQNYEMRCLQFTVLPCHELEPSAAEDPPNRGADGSKLRSPSLNSFVQLNRANLLFTIHSKPSASETQGRFTLNLSRLSSSRGSAMSLSGRVSRVVEVSDRGWLCPEFEPSTTKDLPCRAAMHAKSFES
ncbi:hypothetical protein TNCV_3737201 [Trichonephila clavipes]|nr:hypothetical protein TNCV_3737201 [Trichonephila clavipes]